MAVGGIAGRAHTGFTTQCIDFQTCVVGETVIAVSVLYPAGFYHGVLFESGSCFGYVVAAAYVGERQYAYTVARYPAYFR